MLGYVNNTNRILHEWYLLFKEKHNTLSIQEYKNWKNIIQLGLKSCKNDYFRNFSQENFFKYNFVFNKNMQLNISQCEKLSLSIDCNRLVFINGQFSSTLSDSIIDPWILTFDHNNVDQFKISNSIQPTMFSFLTACLSNAIIKIRLPEKITTKKPLYLLHICEGSVIPNQLSTSHYYYHINIEKDAHACIIEHFININHQDKHFVGDRVCISIGDHAQLNHTKLIFENHSSFHISHLNIDLKKSAHINSNVFIIDGPMFTYHQVYSKIHHAKSLLSLNTLSFLSDKDVNNIQTYLEHNNQDYSISKQIHKIIANDCSIGIFDGLIKVNQNSIKTNGKMTNNNLLLNNKAAIYSTPKLEIYSDAVKCSHGTTVGQIDSNCLFYLNTRGITKKDAVKMLIYAFAEEIIETIKHPLLKTTVLKKIHKSFTRKKI